MILDAIRESGGTAIAVDENRIVEWMKLAMSSEGVSVCPESATCVGAAVKLMETGWLDSTDRVVLYNCGAAQKYVDVTSLNLPRIDHNDFRDWEWSSYNRILMNNPSRLKKKEVLDWFGGSERYIQFHKEHHEDILGNDALDFD